MPAVRHDSLIPDAKTSLFDRSDVNKSACRDNSPSEPDARTATHPSAPNNLDSAADRAVPPPPELNDHHRYELLAFVGSGGMGTVYRARHRLMDRVVALKIINRHLVHNPEMVERFRREVMAAARLDHPNIVRALDADRAGDTHFW